jgi:TetR/AcrR family transcriptional regulator, regulator of autoinduction and epiphytic fitness
MSADAALESVPRARIMAAARKRFEKFGYRATSIALIARDAGIAVGTIYLYFKNKEQILVALFDESNARWMAEAERAANQPGSAEERLLRVAQASMERTQRDQLLRAVMNRDLEMILAPLCEEFRDKVLRHNVEVMADVIRDGVRSGELRSTDPEKTAFILWTTADALFLQKQFRYEELLPTYVGIVRDGLRNPENLSIEVRASRNRTKREDTK